MLLDERFRLIGLDYTNLLVWMNPSNPFKLLVTQFFTKTSEMTARAAWSRICQERLVAVETQRLFLQTFLSVYGYDISQIPVHPTLRHELFTPLLGLEGKKLGVRHGVASRQPGFTIRDRGVDHHNARAAKINSIAITAIEVLGLMFQVGTVFATAPASMKSGLKQNFWINRHGWLVSSQDDEDTRPPLFSAALGGLRSELYITGGGKPVYKSGTMGPHLYMQAEKAGTSQRVACGFYMNDVNLQRLKRGQGPGFYTEEAPPCWIDILGFAKIMLDEGVPNADLQAWMTSVRESKAPVAYSRISWFPAMASVIAKHYNGEEWGPGGSKRAQMIGHPVDLNAYDMNKPEDRWEISKKMRGKMLRSWSLQAMLHDKIPCAMLMDDYGWLGPILTRMGRGTVSSPSRVIMSAEEVYKNATGRSLVNSLLFRDAVARAAEIDRGVYQAIRNGLGWAVQPKTQETGRQAPGGLVTNGKETSVE